MTLYKYNQVLVKLRQIVKTNINHIKATNIQESVRNWNASSCDSAWVCRLCVFMCARPGIFIFLLISLQHLLSELPLLKRLILVLSHQSIFNHEGSNSIIQFLGLGHGPYLKISLGITHKELYVSHNPQIISQLSGKIKLNKSYITNWFQS